MHRLLSIIIPLSLCAIQNTAIANEPIPKPFQEARKTAHFSIGVSQDECQEMLSKLPPVSIEPNKEKILSQLAKRLKRETKELTEEEREKIAQQIYATDVLPMLEPRVEKFNELLNEAIKDNKVSAGFIAFRGLAKSMAASKDESTITISGTFLPDNGETGTWSWDTFSGGVTSSRRHISGAIDETIKIDLKPYGLEGKFEYPLTCSGTVQLEKKYQKNYHFLEKPRGARETTVRITPKITLTVSRDMTMGSQFILTGESYVSEYKTVAYDATLEFAMKAEPRK